MAIDPELVTALKQAKTKPMFFVFVAKGAESKLLVAKKKISPKEAAEAKKECGGGTIYKGRCKGDEGTMVFEVGKKVPESLSALTKKFIKQSAGLTLDVEYRVATDLEQEEDETETTEKPETAGDLEARWKQNLAAWTPAIKAAMTAKGPRTADIAKLLAQATALSKPGGDMVQALARLSECHMLATETETASTDPAEEWERRVMALEPKVLEAQKTRGGDAKWMTMFMTAQDLGSNGDFAKSSAVLDKLEALLSAPPNASTSTDPSAEWKKNLAAWTPAIKAAMTAKGPGAADIAKLLAQATALSKPGGDIDQALAKLTECHALAIQSAENEAPPGETEEQTDTKAEVTQRLKALMPDYQKVKGSPIDKERDFTATMGKLLDLSSRGQYEPALELLGTVEPAIRSAARAAGAQAEIKQQAGGNVVRFRTCRLEWENARKTAEQQISAFRDAVLAEEELQLDPQFPEISANLDQLKDRLAPYGEELYDLLDKAMVAKTEEERSEHNRACVVQIEKYRKLLAGADALDQMEDTSFGSFTIYSALSDALDKMSGLLA